MVNMINKPTGDVNQDDVERDSCAGDVTQDDVERVSWFDSSCCPTSTSINLLNLLNLLEAQNPKTPKPQNPKTPKPHMREEGGTEGDKEEGESRKGGIRRARVHYMCKHTG